MQTSLKPEPNRPLPLGHRLPCCPLFEPTEDDLFTQVATGTLLRARDKYFMLTAGHVCDLLAEANFIFPSSEGFSILHGDIHARDAKRVGDIYDHGFVLLDQGTANEMQHQFVFAQPKDVDVNEYPLEGDWYSFSGFPYRKRKIVGKSVLSPLCSYHLQAAPKDVYINLGVNPYSHIICNFDRKRYTGAGARSLTAPLPHGLSGGAVINYTKELDPRKEPTERKLAGICTEYHPRTNLLIGVRIAGFIKAITSAFPELAGEFEEIVMLT